MTKAQQAKKELIAEQKKNYEELKKMIADYKTPNEKDINYLQGVMKGKKYNRANRTELTRVLDEMEAKLKPSTNALTFEKTEQKKSVKVIQKVKGLGKDSMSDRTIMFEDIRGELFKLADKCTTYSRMQSGGAALRLSQVAANLTRLAKQKLRA